MAEKNERLKNQEQLNRFREAMVKTIGNAIRKPIAARLGYQDENGAIFVQVPDDRTDQPNKYYFHDAGGTGYQGEAWLQPGALQQWQIRYNAPIYIRKNPLTGEDEIIGIDNRYAQQFFIDTGEDDGVIYPYDKLAPGLLTVTTPFTMKARVLTGAYRLGQSFKYIATQETVDWGALPDSANVPTTNLRGRLALVQVDFANGTLEYKYGDEFPAQLTFDQILDLDNNTNVYVPLADDDHFRAGYVKLTANMTQITRDNIIALQEYLTLADADSGTQALDKIVTANGNVVVDVVTGNVVYVA